MSFATSTYFFLADDIEAGCGKITNQKSAEGGGLRLEEIRKTTDHLVCEQPLYQKVDATYTDIYLEEKIVSATCFLLSKAHLPGAPGVDRTGGFAAEFE